MRQRFEQQMGLKTLAISKVKFPLKSRDELRLNNILMC